MEATTKPKAKTKPFRYFYLEGRKRFKSSQLVVAEVQARLETKKWLEEEARA